MCYAIYTSGNGYPPAILFQEATDQALWRRARILGEVVVDTGVMGFHANEYCHCLGLTVGTFVFHL